MDSKRWIRGFAVSFGIAGLGGISYGQNYAPPGSGLAPNSFPAPSLPAYPSITNRPMVIGNGYPYFAQNAPTPAVNNGHMLVPNGYENYPAAEHQPGTVPSVSGSQLQVQPSHTAPLPPIDQSQMVQSSHASNLSTSAPMYQVAPQQYPTPQPTPMNQPPYQSGPTTTGTSSGSCQSCNQPNGDVWSGYGSTSSLMSCGTGCSNRIMGGIVSPRPWIFGANALIMNRVDTDYVRFSSFNLNNGPPALSTFDARMRTSGGVEVFGGRYFGCGKYALIGSYWGLFPEDQTRTVYDPEFDTSGNDYLQTNLPFTVLGPGGAPASLHGIEMPGGANVLGTNGGVNVYDWYNNAYAHRLIRTQDYNNAEISLFSFALGGAVRNGVANVPTCGTDCGSGCGTAGGWTNGRIGRGLHGAHAGGCGSCGVASCTGCTGACAPITGAQCSPLRFAWLGGIRWFRFGDYLEYASSQTDGNWGGADDFYYRNTVRNDLLGFQLGGRATYCTGRRVNLYGGTKFGVFGNRINYNTYAGTNTTAAIVSSYNAYDNQAYDLRSAVTGLSLLGEGELGFGVRLSSCWTANVGYRVIGVSGIATAPGQIPYDFSLLNDVQRIHQNESLILHGVSVGAMYNW